MAGQRIAMHSKSESLACVPRVPALPSYKPVACTEHLCEPRLCTPKVQSLRTGCCTHRLCGNLQKRAPER